MTVTLGTGGLPHPGQGTAGGSQAWAPKALVKQLQSSLSERNRTSCWNGLDTQEGRSTEGTERPHAHARTVLAKA